MARGYWEAKDSHDDLDAEIKVKFNRGYPRDNIIFEDSQTAVLVQNGNEAMRVDMSRNGELHRLIRIFLDYELPEIQEFQHAQSQFQDRPAHGAGEPADHRHGGRGGQPGIPGSGVHTSWTYAAGPSAPPSPRPTYGRCCSSTS